MIFRVTMKDPDVLHDAMRGSIQTTVGALVTDWHISAEEAEDITDRRVEELGNLCAQWFQYGEYLTVEIDTTAKTCVVVPR